MVRTVLHFYVIVFVLLMLEIGDVDADLIYKWTGLSQSLLRGRKTKHVTSCASVASSYTTTLIDPV